MKSSPFCAPMLPMLVTSMGTFCGVPWMCSCRFTWPRAYPSWLLPCALLPWCVQRYYLASSRELTRITSTSKAPIINSFSGALSSATPELRPTQAP